jgi:demethylmenaquinone methyltransferase/2-methoxy-6-polyprenyl-1,4-benzoquinol methylase
MCGGTGDLALELARLYPEASVLLVDFAEEMLRLGETKLADPEANGHVFPVAGDACCLPLPDGSCAGVTAAFGLRNLRSVEAGLREAYRALEPGGRLAILEFFRPTGPLGPFKRLGLSTIIPAVAYLVAPRRIAAYQYLTSSIRGFLSVEEIVALLAEVGFADIRAYGHPMGVATVLGATRR